MTVMPLPPPPLRPLPGPRERCADCGAVIVWARTVASPSGAGGKRQAFEPYEDPTGRVALFDRGRGVLTARALMADEAVDRPLELQGVPHVAACAARRRVPVPPTPGVVVSLAEARGRLR